MMESSSVSSPRNLSYERSCYLNPLTDQYRMQEPGGRVDVAEPVSEPEINVQLNLSGEPTDFSLVHLNPEDMPDFVSLAEDWSVLMKSSAGDEGKPGSTQTLELLHLLI